MWYKKLTRVSKRVNEILRKNVLRNVSRCGTEKCRK